MTEQSGIPFWKSLSQEERIQVKMLLRFLAFIVATIITIGLILSLVSNSLYGG